MREDAVSRAAIFVWEDQARHEARLAGDPALLADRIRQAAAAGDVGAQLSWGHMLLDGHGVARNPEAALRWFQIAARSRNADAINMVGRCHELGWGTDLSARMAAHCYRVAAGMGHAWAQFNLASLMLIVNGAEGDRGEVLALLARSARRGNAKAMNLIGQACEEGWRGPPKIAAARRWYARAAKRGCFRGAFNTARHVMDDGDVEGAVVWLKCSVAAAPGNFCAGLGDYLAAHPDPRLREVAELALERARGAPPQPVSRPPLLSAPIAPRPRIGALGRGRRSVRRALRALKGPR